MTQRYTVMTFVGPGSVMWTDRFEIEPEFDDKRAAWEEAKARVAEHPEEITIAISPTETTAPPSGPTGPTSSSAPPPDPRRTAIARLPAHSRPTEAAAFPHHAPGAALGIAEGRPFFFAPCQVSRFARRCRQHDTAFPPPSNPSSSSAERHARLRSTRPAVSPAHRCLQQNPPGPMRRSITARSTRATVARSDHCSSIRPRTRQIPASRSVFGRMIDSGSLPAASASMPASLTGPGTNIDASPKKMFSRFAWKTDLRPPVRSCPLPYM